MLEHTLSRYLLVEYDRNSRYMFESILFAALYTLILLYANIRMITEDNIGHVVRIGL